VRNNQVKTDHKKKKKIMLMAVIITIIIISFVSITYWYLVLKNEQTTDGAYVDLLPVD
jgi:multidrug resistance efflux pump